MPLIIGLGNPGKKYSQTKHNVGYLTIDFLHNYFECSEWKLSKKTQSWISSNDSMILAKPDVFMNESGISVKALCKDLQISTEKLLVIHDDTDLYVGDYKIQTDRGPAGHNGVASIIEHLKTQNFTRIRIGVRPEFSILSALDLVLLTISQSELAILETVFQKIPQEIQSYIN